MPEAVPDVNTSQVSDEVVNVSWSPPGTVNGILQHYVLVYREYDNPSSDVEVIASLPATSHNVSGLSELQSQPAAHVRAYTFCTYILMHGTLCVCVCVYACTVRTFLCASTIAVFGT